MKNTVLILFLFFIALNTIGQRKIKIDGQDSIVFVLRKDSSAIPLKEAKDMLNTFYFFFSAVQKNDTIGYKNLLSPLTIDNILPEKLLRKFAKFKRYNVNLYGKLAVGSIQLYNRTSFEENPVYVCVVRLPANQTILKRVGFDPLKKIQFEGKENYVALHLVNTTSGYRVVIPW